MAVLLSNTRGSTILGGSVIERAYDRQDRGRGHVLALRTAPRARRVASVSSLLGCVIVCWLRAAALLLLARPVLDQLNDHRWRTGAPLDPRVRWLSTPTAGNSQAAWSWAQVNMMLGAARVRRERIQLAETWTFITVACFLCGPRRSCWGREEASPVSSRPAEQRSPRA